MKRSIRKSLLVMFLVVVGTIWVQVSPAASEGFYWDQVYYANGQQCGIRDTGHWNWEVYQNFPQGFAYKGAVWGVGACWSTYTGVRAGSPFYAWTDTNYGDTVVTGWSYYQTEADYHRVIGCFGLYNCGSAHYYYYDN